jgi:hypothetical protein
MKRFLLFFLLPLLVLSQGQTILAQSSNVTLVGQGNSANSYFNSLFKSGNYLYTFQWLEPWNKGLGIYDISVPSNPQLVNFNTSFDLNSDGLTKIAVKGNYLYASSSDIATLLIFDISNPLQIDTVGSVGTFDSTYAYSLGLKIVGNYLYLCCFEKG